MKELTLNVHCADSVNEAHLRYGVRNEQELCRGVREMLLNGRNQLAHAYSGKKVAVCFGHRLAGGPDEAAVKLRKVGLLQLKICFRMRVLTSQTSLNGEPVRRVGVVEQRVQRVVGPVKVEHSIRVGVRLHRKRMERSGADGVVVA